MKQDRLIDFNPAAVVELPAAHKPKALVWTDERIQQWHAKHQRRLATEREQRAGKRVNVLDVYIATPRPSPVMVWTPALTADFLAYARRHRLFALFRLVALRGLRRGEACGLRWQDVNLQTASIAIRWQITQLGWQTDHGKPKTDASDRSVVLDADTLAALTAHQRRQDDERQTAGREWADSGFVFTTETGAPLHPARVTDQFEWLCYEAGLPPIRLHDLRHGAASLMLAAGVELKVVQETLGHTSSTFTRDTYTSVFPEVAKAAAERTAALLPIVTLPALTGDRP
jgi:integrase